MLFFDEGDQYSVESLCCPSDPFSMNAQRIQSAKPGQYPGGASQILKEIIRKDGLLGTYAGIGPAMIRAFPANAACFTGYELAMRGLNFIAPPRRDHD